MTGEPVILEPGTATRGHSEPIVDGPPAPPGFFAGSGAKVTIEPHCANCHFRLAHHVTEPWEIRCRKCKRINFGGETPPHSPPRKDGNLR